MNICDNITDSSIACVVVCYLRCYKRATEPYLQNDMPKIYAKGLCQRTMQKNFAKELCQRTMPKNNAKELSQRTMPRTMPKNHTKQPCQGSTAVSKTLECICWCLCIVIHKFIYPFMYQCSLNGTWFLNICFSKYLKYFQFMFVILLFLRGAL